jgi:hypothetical protein
VKWQFKWRLCRIADRQKLAEPGRLSNDRKPPKTSHSDLAINCLRSTQGGHLSPSRQRLFFGCVRSLAQHALHSEVDIRRKYQPHA